MLQNVTANGGIFPVDGYDGGGRIMPMVKKRSITPMKGRVSSMVSG